MNLTTKGRYAVMAVADLAMYGGKKPMSLTEISSRQDISLSYLEQLFSRLRKKGKIVKSVRGPGGGYKLATKPEKIPIISIIEAANEPMKITRCTGANGKGCTEDKVKCITHDLWEGLSDNIRQYLSGIMLSDICKDRTCSAKKELKESA